jgi:hypothetical protein
MILNGMVHDARVVRIGGKHVPSTIRRWMGEQAPSPVGALLGAEDGWG